MWAVTYYKEYQLQTRYHCKWNV